MRHSLRMGALLACVAGAPGLAAGACDIGAVDAAAPAGTTAGGTRAPVNTTAATPGATGTTATPAGVATAPMGPAPSAARDLRQLRDAAAILRSHGKDDACQEVVEAAREIARTPAAPGDRAAAAAPTSGTAEQSERSYRTAVPLTEAMGRLRAEQIIGSDVRDLHDESVGEIDDLVLGAKGQSGYAIVAFGGWLGIGVERVAVPLQLLRVSADGDVFYLPMTEKELDQAPRFKSGDYGWIEETEWRRKNDAFFGVEGARG